MTSTTHLQFRRSLVVPHTIEVFQVNPNPHRPEDDIDDYRAEVFFLDVSYLIRLTGFSKNHQMAYSYQIVSVKNPQVALDFVVNPPKLGSNCVEYKILKGEHKCGSVEVPAPTDYGRIKLADLFTNFYFEELVAKRDGTASSNSSGQEPAPSYTIQSTEPMDTIKQQFTQSPSTWIQIPSAPLASLQKGAKIANKITVREAASALRHGFANKDIRKPIAEASADRNLFYSASIPGKYPAFPVFATLAISSPLNVEKEIALVGSVFGGWVCDVLHVAGPLGARAALKPGTQSFATLAMNVVE